VLGASVAVAGCTFHPGSAAVVNGSTISQGTIDGLVTAGCGFFQAQRLEQGGATPDKSTAWLRNVFTESLIVSMIVDKAANDLNLTVMQPLVSPDDLWQTDPDECCAMRKVEPLARALRGKQAWMTGLRRVESPTRTNAPIVHLDVGRGIVKVNPLATWSDADIAAYKQDHELLEHPLSAQGYPSIGCWPCTRPVAPGEDPRSGRWSGQGKMECGLHGWPEA